MFVTHPSGQTGGPFNAFQFQTVRVSVDLTATGAATLDEFDIAMSYDPTQLFVATSGAFTGPQAGNGFSLRRERCPQSSGLATIAVDAYSCQRNNYNSGKTLDLLYIDFTDLQSPGNPSPIINLQASIPLSPTQTHPTDANGTSSAGDQVPYTLTPAPSDTAGGT